MPIRAGDTFVEAVDTTLASHTPTGPDAGSSWTSVSGAIQVVAATDVASETNDSSGNRYLMTNDLGSIDMIVEGVFTNSGAGSIAMGLLFRADASGLSFCEASYDNDNGQWVITDLQGNSTLTEAWPGGSVTMRVEADGGEMRLYVNGTLKVTRTSWVSYGPYAGIVLLNFSGAGSGKMTCDNYLARGYTRYFLIKP